LIVESILLMLVMSAGGEMSERQQSWNEARLCAIVAEFKTLEGPLLPILHAVQEAFGYVPQLAVPIIARELNLSRAEVHGVITFYHDFRDKPAGRHVLKICRAEACQSMGCEALVRHAEARLGVECGSTAANDQVTLEAVYCLGLCAMSPAAMIDGEPVARLSAVKLANLLTEIGA
jgi:formate dehydrogenase subunit gamma